MTTLFERVFKGSDEMYAVAESAIAEASEKYDDSEPVGFPDTAYYLACNYAMSGNKVTNFGELKQQMQWVKNEMTRNNKTYDIFHNGIATACAAEIAEACKYIRNTDPYGHDPLWGHCNDAEVRELGLPLVTGDIPGFSVIIGPAPTQQEAVDLVKGYQAKSMYTFMVGGIIDQVVDAGVATGYKVRIVPLGYELWSVSHVVSLSIRAALIFGAIQPGDYEGIRDYTFKRINAVVNAFDPVDDMTVACGAGAISLGYPVITNHVDELWKVPRSLIIQTDISKWIETSIEARRIKIKVTDIDIPVAFSNAFEGEIIRRKDMYCEVDGSRYDCLELVRTLDTHEVEDHKIEVVGPDLDDIEPGSNIQLAAIVDLAGRKMNSDFEPVFERKFHSYINCAEGVMHTGQRDMIRIRISNDAYEAGFRIKHIGEILYGMLMSDYGEVIDKCQVTLYTDPEKATEWRKIGNEIYDKRDERLESLTDETVDEFYTCTMCQSFSPSHVCIVTPERLGLCGAVSWLDAKATNQLDPTGACQIVLREGVIDERIGKWESINEAVKKYSMGALEVVSLYSIMEDPMTSCGCFECICGIEPFTNGVVIVHREHTGVTPLGMSFSEMASMTGGGVQTPGFMGHGKHFISSKKFMSAEGGPGRIVWMPKALKDQVGEKLNETAKELYGIDNFVDMIADETICEDPETLLNYITEKNHPVLGMEPLM